MYHYHWQTPTKEPAFMRFGCLVFLSFGETCVLCGDLITPKLVAVVPGMRCMSKIELALQSEQKC